MSKPPSKFSLPSDTLSSLRAPEFWSFAAWLDIITKYRRSGLGVLWLIIPPAATVGGLGYFYAAISHKEPLQFMPYMGLGYILWRFVTQVLSEAAGTMLGHRPFIMDGNTRLTDYIFRCVSRATLYFAAAMLVVLLIYTFSPEFHLLGLLSLLITIPIFLLNMFSLGVVVAVLGVRYRDMHEFTTTIFIFGMLLTPILWYPDKIPVFSVRWFFMQANPAYHLIELVRAPLLGRPLGHINIVYIGAMTVFGWVLASGLYRRYSRFVPLWI